MPVPSNCPSLEALEQLASGGSIDNGVIDHAQQCETCQSRVREIRQNLALLPDLAMLRAPSPSWSGPEHSIEGYDIHDTIARGSQGVVYHATQRATKRAVAIKVLLGGKFATQRQRIRFEREVELAAALRHPNIVTYFDSGATADGRRFCVMELVNGRSLGDHLETLAAANQQPSQQEILNLFLKICSAVAYAHQRGVIHRDLKPANILIDAAGEPRVVDFGLARNLEALKHVHEPTVTHPGEFAGTFAYASPEQTMGGGDVDVRSDVYSLGVILFEMLTTKLPYKTSGPLSGVIKAICEQPPLSPSQLRPEVHYEIETILFKALSKSPERRYQSVSALMRDIEHHLRGEPIDAKRDSKWYVIRKTVHRHRYAASAALLALMLLTGFSILMAVAYRRASNAEAIAAARSTELADSLSRSNIERGRVLATSGNVALAEETLWREYLTSTNPDEELSPARWALRELYLRNPCISSLTLTPTPSNEHVMRLADDGAMIYYGDLTVASVSIRRTGDGATVSKLQWPDVPIARACVFETNGKTFVTALADHSLARFDIATGVILFRGKPLERLSARLVTSSDGKHLASCDTDEGMTLIDADTLTPIWSIPTPTPLINATFSSDDTAIVTGGNDGTLRIYSTADGALLRSTPPRESISRIGRGISTIVASRDGKRIVTASETGIADVWNPADLSAPLHRNIDTDAIAMAISPDSQWLAVGGNDRTIRLHHFETGEERRFASHAGPIRSLAFSVDGLRLTSFSKDSGIRTWDLTPCFHQIRRHTYSVLCAARSERDDLFATGSADGSVVVSRIDLEHPATVRIDSVVHSIALSSQHVLAAGDREGKLHLWPVSSDRSNPSPVLGQARIIDAHRSAINSLVFSPDGALLATGSQDGSAALWNARTLTPHAPPLEPVDEQVSSIAFSPDGALLAIGGKRSFDVKWWDTKTGRQRPPLTGHTDVVRCVTFSPDGKWIASGSDDQTIRLWSVADGKCVAVFEGHQRAVFGLCFRQDGRMLASSGGGGDVRLWSVPERRLLASFAVSHEIQLGVELASDGKTLWTWGTSPDLTRLDLFRADAFVEGNRAYWKQRVGK